MRKRSLWLLGGSVVVLLVAMVVGPQVVAQDIGLGLEVVPDDPMNDVDCLHVFIDPQFLGGEAELFARFPEMPEEDWIPLMQFPLDNPEAMFEVPRIAPPGTPITYQYHASDMWGNPVGMSMLAVAGDRLDPGWEE